MSPVCISLTETAGKYLRTITAALLTLGLCAAVSSVQAASLVAMLTDQQGSPIDDAVVYVRRIDGAVPASTALKVVVDQIDETFVPHVRAVTIGSEVSFPNSDHVHHHVYSFSETKTFEVPLYIGIPASPIVFDKPGLVTLGCNIHDHMLGYILVLETPYFAEVSEGVGRIAELPAGEWLVEIWHPRMSQPEPISRSLSARADGELSLSLELELTAERQSRRAPRRGGSRY